MLSLAAANNANLYISNSIKFGGVTSLNNTLSSLGGFDVNQYMNMVKVRWGQAAYNSLAATMVYTQEFKLAEHHLYGSGRLGIKYADTTLVRREFTINGFDTLGNFVLDDVLDSTKLTIDTVNYYRTLAKKQYHLTNHLGDVLASVFDRRTPIGSSSSTISRYTADVASAQNYYAFGQIMQRWNGDTTFVGRYGYNGKELDDKDGVIQYDYGERIYDSRNGRFLSSDPLSFAYPMLSPYQYASNMPILAKDLDGLEADVDIYGSNQFYTYKAFKKAGLTNEQAQVQTQYLLKEQFKGALNGFLLGAAVVISIHTGLRINPATIIATATSLTLTLGKYGPDAIGFAASMMGYDGEIPGVNGDNLGRLINSAGVKFLKRAKEIYKLGELQNIAVAKFTNKLTKETKRYVANSGESKPGTAPLPDDANRLFTIITDRRRWDTEVKILETIAKDLGGVKGQVNDKVEGTVTIISDLSACTSCENVIKQFQTMFPNIKVIMGSTGKTTYSNK